MARRPFLDGAGAHVTPNKNKKYKLNKAGNLTEVVGLGSISDTEIGLSGDKSDVRNIEELQRNDTVLVRNIKEVQDLLNAEETARTSTDNTLQNNIDAEETARISAVNTVASNLTSEENSRALADSALDTRVTSLEVAPTYAPLACQASEPANSNIGDQWYNTATNILYIRVNDGDSIQWIDISTDTLMADYVASSTYNADQAAQDTLIANLLAALGTKVSKSGDTMTGNLEPETDNVHSLGSANKRWKDVYIGPGSLYIGDQKVLESDADTIVVTADLNQNVSIRTKGTGDLELTTDTGAIQLKSDMMVTPGKGFNTSNSSKIPFHSGISVSGETIEQVAEPVNSTDAATKAYVDAQTAGVDLSGIANNATDINTLQTSVTNIESTMSTDTERLAAVTALTNAYDAADTALNNTLTAAINNKDSVIVQDNPPVVGSEGSLFFNSSLDILYVSTGTVWEKVSNPAPSTTGGVVNIPVVEENSSMSYNLGQDFTDESEPDSALSYTLDSGSLPAGLSLPSSGMTNITGTASTVNNNTTYNFGVKAMDPEGAQAVQLYSITVNTVGPSTISGGTENLGSGDEGTSYSKDISSYFTYVGGTSQLTYAFVQNSLPGTSCSQSGNISGTLGDVSSDTNYYFVIRATDPDGDYVDKAFEYTINYVPPVGAVDWKPGTSCKNIYDNGGNTGDHGDYWVSDNGSGAFQVYCDMSNGGWTLVMKATDGSTFHYNSSHWGSTSGTLGDECRDTGVSDAKSKAYGHVTGSTLKAIFPDNNNYTWERSMGGSMTTKSRLYDNSNYHIGDPWSVPEFSSTYWRSQSGMRWYGFNYYQGSHDGRVRWGFAWNNEGDHNSNDVTGGIGLYHRGTQWSAGTAENCCCHHCSAPNTTHQFLMYIK